MPTPTAPVPSEVKRALERLGADVSEARRRRRLPMEVVADRALTTRQTVARIERGDPRVAMGTWASVLFALGLANRLGELAAPAGDREGLALEAERLPKRVRGAPDGSGESVIAPTADVYIDMDGAPRLVGRLYVTAHRGRETATFQYDDTWIASNDSFALEPALSVSRAPHYAGEDRRMFRALGDSAPDRWGQTLLRRAERRQAKDENRAPRALREVDFLLGVTDSVRQGALRLALTEGGPFIAPERPSGVPRLVELPALLAASERYLADQETAEDMRLLLAPGSSLGGARPKVSVRDTSGSPLIAKFPKRNEDDYRVVAWEAVALQLARDAGLRTTDSRLDRVVDNDVLLVTRFDRDVTDQGVRRIPYLSAMSMLGAVDGERRSYVEIADALRAHGAAATHDLAELWRRIVFSVLISNTDDHLRNHGFLYAGFAGWRLSPVFDVNPVPTDVKDRVLSTAIGPDGDPTASLEIALEVAPQFGMKAADAKRIAAEVGAATARWNTVAASFGIEASEIERMGSAFEHEDSRAAASLSRQPSRATTGVPRMRNVYPLYLLRADAPLSPADRVWELGHRGQCKARFAFGHPSCVRAL